MSDTPEKDLEPTRAPQESPVPEAPAEGAEDEIFADALEADDLVPASESLSDGEEDDDLLQFPLAEELRLEAKIEAIIFASPKPMRTTEIFELLQDSAITMKDVQDALDGLTESYRDRCGGFHLRYLKRMGYQFQTVPAAARIMERQFASRPRPISRAALETLAIIAYRQPVTRADVEYIRGVDAGSIMKGLLERNLISCVGRKEIAGRPMMFGTTEEFLKVFQIGSVKDLPPLESFQPSPEAMQGAMEKLEAGGEPVDVEDFIGDDEYANETTEHPSDINPTNGDRQGASAAQSEEDLAADAPDETLTAKPDEATSERPDTDDNDQPTDVDLEARPGEPLGSEDLDH